MKTLKFFNILKYGVVWYMCNFPEVIFILLQTIFSMILLYTLHLFFSYTSKTSLIFIKTNLKDYKFIKFINEYLKVTTKCTQIEHIT